jgi:hypothetical protein
MRTQLSNLTRSLSLGLYLLCVFDGASPASELTSAAAEHGATAQDAVHRGIWKSATPPSGSMHGEFDNNDPIGLAAGTKIPADCSLNWVDPDFHKLYCFSSATSLVYFLDSPRAFLARARKNWPALSHSGS